MRDHRFPLLAILLACSSTLADDRNILVNGDFEAQGSAWSYAGRWLLDAAQARGGEGCLSGEVDGPKQSLTARQTITLQPNSVYTIRLWARGTPETKVAVLIERGSERRKLAQFLHIPDRWTLFDIGFFSEQGGDWELQLVFPSSYNASPGRVWVDDVSVDEMLIEPVAEIASGAGISEFPAIVADGEGLLYMTWIETVAGADRVQVAVAEPAASGFRVIHRSGLPLEADAVESVTLAGDAMGAWVCLSAERDEGWDIYCARIEPQGPSPGSWVTRDNAVDIHPAVTARGGSPWVVWESNRDGTRQIYAAELPLGTGALRLSDLSDSAYYPTVTGDGAGRIWAAWQQFVDGQYDIVWAAREAGSWRPASRLTASPYLDQRPSLTWSPDGPWLAWEVSAFPADRTSYAAWRRVLAARVTDGRLEAPVGAWDAHPLWSGNPRLLAGSDGRIHLTLRTSEGLAANWWPQLTSFDGTGWSDPLPLGRSAGRNRAVPLAEAAGRLWLAVQHDNIAGSWNSVEASGSVASGIGLAEVPVGPALADPHFLLTPLVLPATRFDPNRIRKRKGEDRPRHAIDYGGQRLELYFGQLHEHSEISFDSRRKDLSPDDNYMANRDIDRLDFSALTDHDFNLSAHIWTYLGKLARWQHDPHRYVTFLAQEWTSSFDHETATHPHGYYGHRNLIIADTRYPKWFNAREGMTPAGVWAALAADGVDFVHVPHQLADTGNVPTDWGWVDEVAQPVAEIFQLRGSYEAAGAPRAARNTAPGHFLAEAWNNGVIIGVIASPDHGGGRGKAAVYAPRLTRDAILDGLRARHSYGTTGAKIWLDFRVDGRLMGEKLPLRPGPVPIDVTVSGPGALESVVILRDGQVVHAATGDGNQASFRWTDPRPPEDGTYYYLRVRQVDREMAWSSPVWFLRDTETPQRRTGSAEPIE